MDWLTVVGTEGKSFRTFGGPSGKRDSYLGGSSPAPEFSGLLLFQLGSASAITTASYGGKVCCRCMGEPDTSDINPGLGVTDLVGLKFSISFSYLIIFILMSFFLTSRH